MFDDEKLPLRCDRAARQQPRPKSRRRLIAVLLPIAALAFIVVVPWLLPAASSTGSSGGNAFDNADQVSSGPDGRIDLTRLFFDVLSTDRLRSNLEYYTSGVHPAGANQTQATHTLEHFKQHGLDAEIVEYYPWLGRPVSQRVAVFNATTHVVEFEAGLQEDVVPGDPASENPNNLAAFHAYSAGGNVTGRLVYANYGRPSDFGALKRAGVSVKDSIAIVRYGKVLSNVKVHAAELAGARGVLIYSDPADDGYVRGNVYPAGPWRPESSIQRDSVLRQGVYPGDPLTPGYPSTKGAQRIEPSEAASLSSIPSLPLSYRDALPLLSATQGHGVAAGSIDDAWVGGLTSKGIEYWTGPSKLMVNLENRVTYETTPIQNVVGRIKGWEDPGQAVVIGNHRDAWSAGASDPSSGAAVLLELARAFGELSRLGWRPRRTIVLASWDATEHGLVGSTEWVEENVDWLRASAVAYINVGAAVEGDIFTAAASPLLQNLLYAVAKQVPYPHSNETVFDAWLRQSPAMQEADADIESDADIDTEPRPLIDTLGLHGDSVAFALHAGISSADLGFSGSSGARHSNFDSFKRMITFVDSDMRLHLAVAQLWGLLAIRLADDPVLPLCAGCYAKDLKRFIRQFERQMRQRKRHTGDNADGATVSKKLRRLRSAQHQLKLNARVVEHDKRHLRSVYGEDCSMTGRRRHTSCLALRASINDRLANLERHFIDPDGVPGREWYKHALFGPEPERWIGETAHQPFPALAAALESQDSRRLRLSEKGIADIIHEAAWFLRED
ncbi:Vacuolar protein sorting-associated protein 70 [Coemansia sp. RSA 2711]|nr:Vacuolar protein sorting-associated protein 70 [Coemansia sp. RSA 2711]